MNLSPDRQDALAKAIAQRLVKDPNVTVEERDATLRRRLKRLLDGCVRSLDEQQAEAERSVRKMKRRIPEGSAEWDLLVRKNLMAALDRLDRFQGSRR